MPRSSAKADKTDSARSSSSKTKETKTDTETDTVRSAAKLDQPAEDGFSFDMSMSRAVAGPLSAELAGRVAEKLRVIPQLRFDQHLPKEMQKNTADYERRSKRTAAVLIPLCNVAGEASVIFTVRSGTVGSHKGHVSFPGGHIDADETPEAAALREASEEIGLEQVKVIGRFHAMRAVTGTMVYPVVGFVNQKDFADIDEVREMVHAGTEDGGEVEQVFSATLSQLTHPENVEYENLGGRYSRSPRFQIGEFPVIWGLTAFILHGFLKEVMVPITSVAGTVDADTARLSSASASASASVSASGADPKL